MRVEQEWWNSLDEADIRLDMGVALCNKPEREETPQLARQRKRERYMRLLRLPDVMRLTGLSRQTIWRMERDGNFPSRRIIGARTIAWVESEVLDWISNAPTASEVAR